MFMAFSTLPDHMVISFSTIFSVSVPPSGIMPSLPFPSGKVDSQIEAGESYLIIRFLSSALRVIKVKKERIKEKKMRESFMTFLF